MTFDDLFATGFTRLSKGDRVEIVALDDAVVAGPLTVEVAICAIGDWIHLTDERGETYLEGNMTAGGECMADLSHLPQGWRFRVLAPL